MEAVERGGARRGVGGGFGPPAEQPSAAFLTPAVTAAEPSPAPSTLSWAEAELSYAEADATPAACLAGIRRGSGAGARARMRVPGVCTWGAVLCAGCLFPWWHCSQGEHVCLGVWQRQEGRLYHVSVCCCKWCGAGAVSYLLLAAS